MIIGERWSASVLRVAEYIANASTGSGDAFRVDEYAAWLRWRIGEGWELSYSPKRFWRVERCVQEYAEAVLELYEERFGAKEGS